MKYIAIITESDSYVDYEDSKTFIDSITDWQEVSDEDFGTSEEGFQ